jgi:hypothetical protein
LLGKFQLCHITSTVLPTNNPYSKLVSSVLLELHAIDH